MPVFGPWVGWRDELAETEAEPLLLRVREMLLAAEDENLVA